MTNTGMFFRMLFSAVFRRRSRAVMAVVASLVGAATLFCLAMICLAVPQQMNEEMRAYGANLIVTPTESTNADGKAGIDKAMVQHTTEMVKAKVPRIRHLPLRERARQRLAVRDGRRECGAGQEPQPSLGGRRLVADRRQGAGRTRHRRRHRPENRLRHHHRLPCIR